VVLQNNDRRTSGDYFDGGAIEVEGSFVMNGGQITANRTSGSGGGIFLHNNKEALIAGGSITGNDAGRNGGGIMLNYYDGKSKLDMTGGLIGGNRANGKVPTFISASLDGYGGGIFIPGTNTSDATNRFRMTGGVIEGNISAGGKGNGVAVDRNNTSGVAPVFILGGTASLVNNDVLLHVDSFWPPLKITVTGPFSPSTPVHITLDSYNILPMPVLTGGFGPYISKFTAAPYGIDSLGRIHQ
jgi:hypothetical protein